MKVNKIDPTLLSDLVPIKALSPEQCQELASKSKLGELKAGHYLYKSGEENQRVFYVLQGDVELVQNQMASRIVTGGTRMAKIPLERRLCTAKVKTDCVYLCVDANLLDNMLAPGQSGSVEVQDLDDEDWMTKILQANIFSKIPPVNIQSIFMRMKEVRTKAGQLVVKQGDVGDSYYIIRNGQCRVVRRTKSAP